MNDEGELEALTNSEWSAVGKASYHCWADYLISVFLSLLQAALLKELSINWNGTSSRQL
jgi:hypothetical protein